MEEGVHEGSKLWRRGYMRGNCGVQWCLDATLTGLLVAVDPLVLYLQLLHDGDLPGGVGEYDPHADTTQGLRQI